MKKFYLRSLKAYEGTLNLDKKKILASFKKLQGENKRVPLAFPMELAQARELKQLAKERGIPFQFLLQKIVSQGIRRLKKTG